MMYMAINVAFLKIGCWVQGGQQIQIQMFIDQTRSGTEFIGLYSNKQILDRNMIYHAVWQKKVSTGNFMLIAQK